MFTAKVENEKLGLSKYLAYQPGMVGKPGNGQLRGRSDLSGASDRTDREPGNRDACKAGDEGEMNEHLKAILEVALSIHDGHDEHDANKHGWGTPPILFESCTRPTCT